MPGIDVNQLGYVARALPAPQPDNSSPTIGGRRGRYGELYALIAQNAHKVLADQGSAFVATSAPGTKVDYGSAGSQASFSDTVPFMMFKNNAIPGPNARRVILDFLRLIQIGGTAPASTTSVQLAVKIDNINRGNTAGTMTLQTPSNTNMDDGTPSGCQLYVPAGAVATIPASSGAARVVGRAQLKGGPTLLLDEYNLIFGADDTPPSAGYPTTVASYLSTLPAVVLGPQQWAILHLWLPGAATNPFSVEWEARWHEV